ncbi:MAG TPA: acetolactate decarboxylase [Longimicrobium sp.]|nr:acetolactate decarboxylase [Longimicrobium sp.]
MAIGSLSACGANPAPNAASAAPGAAAATIWQLAPAELLIQGGYDGILSVAEVQRHGDLGLAGADRLDGEMVLVDGQFYQFLASGQVVQPPSTMRLPFAEVTAWTGGRAIPVTPGLVYDDSSMPTLDSRLDLNAFYAVRMEGAWDTLVVRTFRQQSKPYLPLDSAVHHQAVDTLVNVRGVMVGFRQPQYAKPMSLPNYHLHFITADRTRGGHVLGFRARDVTMQVSERPEFTVHMPPAAPMP